MKMSVFSTLHHTHTTKESKNHVKPCKVFCTKYYGNNMDEIIKLN